MNKGVLIFAQNSEKVDYSLTALIAGGLAKKNLNVPVSLATDEDTIKWMKQSNIYEKSLEVFDRIIKVDNDKGNNLRNLRDGTNIEKVPFKNFGRSNAFDITPYDRTLLIDSDFLIFSSNLNNYWDVDQDVMIGKSMFDMAHNDRSGYHDKYVSDTSVHLYWATTVMFTKNKNSEIFFNLVDTIKKEYSVYSEIYRFDKRVYRNDISFSIAKHIIDGFNTNLENSLPYIPTTYDSDILEDVKEDGRLIFLMSQTGNNFIPMSIKGRDIHIMNKQSLVRNSEKLLKLI